MSCQYEAHNRPSEANGLFGCSRNYLPLHEIRTVTTVKAKARNWTLSEPDESSSHPR